MYELEKRINITQEYKYENAKELISEIATGKNILNFILHLFHISNKRCSNFYVYEPLEKKI